MKAAVTLAAMGVALGACAAPETVGSTESRTEREYRTGSSIPQHVRPGDGVSTMSAEELERVRSATTASGMRRPTGP